MADDKRDEPAAAVTSEVETPPAEAVPDEGQPVAAPQDQPAVAPGETGNSRTPAVAPPPQKARPARKQSSRPAATEPRGARRAAKTLRLQQGVANTLRQAWLHEKRTGDLLLTYQEFAGRVITRGLPLKLRPVEPAPSDSAAPEESAPATMRIEQGVADRLHDAWLDGKRSGAIDVLLSHSEFASRVVVAGLSAEERARR